MSQTDPHTPSDVLLVVDPTVSLPPWLAHVLRQATFGKQLAKLDPATPPDDDLTLLQWARKYLSDHFTRPASEMHRWLAEQLDLFRETRGSRLNVIGPRGSAKSTLATLGYVLRAATAGWEPYIWIISDTTEQAQSHLDNVRAELTENRLLRRNYTVAARRGKLWRKMALALRNGVTIECFGTGQRIRGRRHGAARPTLIVCDDLQNDQHMDSALQRDRSRRWFHGTLLQAGTSRTNVVNLATALHFDALAMQLTRTPGWRSKSFASIQQWPSNTQLWQQWEAIYCDLENPDNRAAARTFYELHREGMDAGAVVLWPQEEDLYTLMCQRMQSGEGAFEREKQSSPVDPERCEWPADYFAGDLWFDAWPESLLVKTMALDPSKGKDARRGDYSAYVMFGVDRQATLYVEADLARRPTPQMVADGVRLLRHFRPDTFGIEANQFQELLAPLFLMELREAGLHAVSPCLVINDVNKGVRIRRLAAYLSMRRLRFKNNCPSTRMLVDQLRQFPHADHDDGPDALEMALRMALELQHGRRPDDGLGDRLVLDKFE